MPSKLLAFFITPILGVLDPHVHRVSQVLASPALRRKVVKSIVASLVLALLVGLSLSAYLGFYWLYIPQQGHIEQVYLQHSWLSDPNSNAYGQYGPEGTAAIIEFSRDLQRGQLLRGDQAYDISVNLEVPTSKRNMELGNFMVIIKLFGSHDGVFKLITSSSRPTMLTYESTPLRLMRTVWRAVPLVLRWSTEAQTIKVPLIENFVEDASNPVTRAYILISNPDLQIYSSTIHIDARFHGLRYFMYYYKFSTAIIFMSIFIFWEVIFSVLTWHLLVGWFGTDSQRLNIRGQQLRAPTSYMTPSPDVPRIQRQSPTATPRQPQLQDDQQLLAAYDSDSEMEDDLLVADGSIKSDCQGLLISHDEPRKDRDLEHLAASIVDEAVVPEFLMSGTQPAPHVTPVTGSIDLSHRLSAEHRVATLDEVDTDSSLDGDENVTESDELEEGSGVRFGESTLFERRDLDDEQSPARPKAIGARLLEH
ncbi:hypothetical protein BG011_000634 [Mortierella polycephala]|uniref:Seipin n=1 Tax=Mortierella polycephala TaxID=41804 RepID=A0A9P6Q6L5_9FUNG|nr:hypothetical protein BG011_000634 [Mortierella polycephala]